MHQECSSTAGLIYLGGSDCDGEDEKKKCLIDKAGYYLVSVPGDYLTADPFTAKHGKH
jgi:hypothetical protein